MNKFLKYIFHISVLSLIIISLYPGSLLGYFFYNNVSKQPDLISNPFGTTINHFISYIYVSLLGLFLYLKSKNFNKLLFGLLLLSTILELFHFIVPNRSFQISDLLANIFGVIVAYSVVRIYLLFNKYE